MITLRDAEKALDKIQHPFRVKTCHRIGLEPKAHDHHSHSTLY